MAMREGADRLVDLQQHQQTPSPFDPNVAIPVEREPPPPRSEGPQTFTRDNIVDEVDDNEFLLSRLGLSMGNTNTNPPPAPQQPPPSPALPNISAAVAPVMTAEQEYAKKVEYLWILRRLRGTDPTFQIPKLSDDLYKIELLVQQVKRENACQDGVESCKFALMFFSGALETVANRPPLNKWLHLKGYSKKLMYDVETDRRFEEAMIALSNKYREKMPSSPELMLAFLIAQSAFSYSVASQMTDAAIGSMSSSSGPVAAAAPSSSQQPPPQPAAPAPPTVSAPPPSTPAQNQTEQLAEIMRILQNRKQQQPPPIPQTPTSEGSGSNSRGRYLSDYASSEESQSHGGRRKRQPQDHGRPPKRPRQEESWASVSDEGEEDASDEEDGEGASASEPSVAIMPARRRIPSKFKNRQRAPSTDAAGSDDDAPTAPPPHVPVVDVRLNRPMRGRPRGRARGRGTGTAARGRRIPSSPLPLPPPTPPPSPTPSNPGGGASANSDEDDGELDMRSVL